MKMLRGTIAGVLVILIAHSGFSQGFLKAAEGKIVNGNSQEVLLRGAGLGGWMLQEPYMLGLSDVAANQTQIKSRIKALIGDSNTTTFYNAWLANHVRKVDVDSMKAWGFNSIRLPLHYNLFTLPSDQEPVAGQDTWLNKGFELTDSLLAWCKANKMYLILDLHAAPGGQGNDVAISDNDKTKPSLWQSSANQQKTVNLWKRIAEHYASEEWIGGYDLLNETNNGFQNPANDGAGCAETGNAPLRQLYINITTAIRSVDNNHLLFIEGNCYANNHAGLFPLWDNNIALSFHKYWNYNDKGSIQNYLNYRTQYKVPVWMGESGENSNSWHRDAIELLEQNNIGWSWWPVKKIGLNCPLEVPTNAGFQDIINYWKGGVQPTATTAFNSLMQLTQDIRLENSFYHKDYIDAMFRQVRSIASTPFKVQSATDVIYASDYDLGRNNVAYYDVDTADFHVSTGTYTAWNSGYRYRNDGVDIENCTDGTTNGYNVGWTQNNEWMQYTLNVQTAGVYDLRIRTAGNGGQVYFTANNAFVTPFINLPSTGGYQTWQTTTVSNIKLAAGLDTFRIYFQTGGSNINYFQWVLRTALPVTFTGLPGKNEKGINVLNWATATEQNNSYFNVQRSIDGSGYMTIATVKTKAANGISTSVLQYTYNDKEPVAGSNYYRLQQVDKDGGITLSSVVMIENGQSKMMSVAVAPNPVKDMANLSVYSAVKQAATLQLYSADGRLVVSRKVFLQDLLQNLSVPMQQLPPGLYRLVINGKNQKTTTNISKQ